ncbi:MAG: hypothetical protein J2P36_39115 [Ktedonobacteraceae bacterium]|nr:hypothetical protein [Ktedonobacteraceae bacterium]
MSGDVSRQRPEDDDNKRSETEGDGVLSPLRQFGEEWRAEIDGRLKTTRDAFISTLLENPGKDSWHAEISTYADALHRAGVTDSQVAQLHLVAAEISVTYDQKVQGIRESSNPPPHFFENARVSRVEWDAFNEYSLRAAQERASDQLMICTLALERRLFSEHTPEYRERQHGIDALLHQRKAEAEMDQDKAWHAELEGSRNDQAIYEFLNWAKSQFLERLRDIITRFDAPSS